MIRRNKSFPPHPIIGDEEKRAVMEVLDNGRLSYFQASPGEHFLGGKKIKELEKLFRDYHNVKYAVAFNSATASLHAAVIACGVQPLKEIITTPYTFTSTATCALMANAIPIFADIKSNDFNIDPYHVEDKILNRPLTKAIIPVHLFGNPADMDKIMHLANRYQLKVIEDCAQAPGALYKGKKVGTMGDCGIFSLTETKTITSGEGGVLITDDEKIAKVARLIRNHGEMIVEDQNQRSYKSTTLGYNYRMTEVDAAIGCEQFKKLDKFNSHRIKLGEYLSKGLSEIEGISSPYINKRNKHVYYIYAISYNNPKYSRDEFVDKMNARGIPLGKGYIKPLYNNPIFRDNNHFVYDVAKHDYRYYKGMCPVAEDCYNNKVVTTVITRPPATFEDMDDVINIIKDVLK